MVALALAEIVVEAAERAGVDCHGAALLRNGSNAMFRLPAGVVARVGRVGRRAVAEREVRVARWLAGRGVRVAEPLDGVAQPIIVRDRPVTWWHELPAHRAGTPAELGHLLRELHRLPRPGFDLPAHDPFTRLEVTIGAATVLGDGDRTWLMERCRRLRADHAGLVPSRPAQLIHGDAWQGNVAVPQDAPAILLDFEKVSIGDPAWDLVQVAVDHLDFERIGRPEYRGFVDAYGGADVVDWPGFRSCADIQELRWLTFALSRAGDDPAALPEVRHRIACVRGEVPKPWSWKAL